MTPQFYYTGGLNFGIHYKPQENFLFVKEATSLQSPLNILGAGVGNLYFLCLDCAVKVLQTQSLSVESAPLAFCGRGPCPHRCGIWSISIAAPPSTFTIAYEPSLLGRSKKNVRFRAPLKSTIPTLVAGARETRVWRRRQGNRLRHFAT